MLNSENTIISLLNSILVQAINDIKHVYVNGNSTDRVTKILNNYTNKNKKLNIFSID